MNYINSSTTMLKETIHSFCSVNRSLASTISKWVLSTTVTTLLQNGLCKQSATLKDSDQLLQDSSCLEAG
jgi:hypothetical protein